MLLKEYWGLLHSRRRVLPGRKTATPRRRRSHNIVAGGFRSVDMLKKMTNKDLNRVPLKIEVYEKVYVPKEGDPPQRIVETRQKYNELNVQAESEGKSYDVDDSELFCKVIPTYRGRWYRTGSEAESLSKSVECSSRHSGPTQQEIDALIQTQVEARFAQHEKVWREQMENMSSAFMSVL